jgi:hypothetical protein
MGEAVTVDKSQADWLIRQLHEPVRPWWPSWWAPRRKTTERIRRRTACRLAAQPAGAGALARDLIHRPDAVAAIGREALAGVTDQDVIDAVCLVWSEARHNREANAGRIGELIGRAGWLASKPAGVRVLTALQGERSDLLADATPELARALVTAADRELPPLRGRDALRSLREQAARDEVCDLAVDQGSPAALDAALAGSFRASAPAKQAVLLFLAGDMERYTEVDFDGALLRAARLSAHPAVRARLARRAAAAGRVEWVRDVAGDLGPGRGLDGRAGPAVAVGARHAVPHPGGPDRPGRHRPAPRRPGPVPRRALARSRRRADPLAAAARHRARHSRRRGASGHRHRPGRRVSR